MRSLPRGRPLRVLLVAPPFRYFPRAASRFGYARPPLGLISLAGHLRARLSAPVEVMLIDQLAEMPLALPALLDRILRLEPDLVGFSTMTPTQPAVVWLTAALRQVRPELWIVAGGPHITALPREEIPGLDALFVGEAEESLVEFIEEVVLGASLRPIPGVVQFRDGEAQCGPERALIGNLDDLAWPARDLLAQRPYYHVLPYPGGGAFTTMMTSRGCPHDCSFCGNKVLWGRRVRHHCVDRVIDEVVSLQKLYGVGLLFFEDDSFTSDRTRTSELLARLRVTCPRLKWICHARADELDEELVREMARSGCVEVQVGAESGDEQVLLASRKQLRLDDLRTGFATLRRHGINSWATFVLGHEQDTPESLKTTIRVACELDPTYASFIVLLPFPGTAVYERFRERSFLQTADWADFTWYGEPVFATDLLTRADLVRARRDANLAFYLRPKKLAQLGWQTLRSASVREMARNFAAWRSLLGRAAD
jgi:anaerobic magnesium-protoporphyrin IX monomethyl ester cyclase